MEQVIALEKQKQVLKNKGGKYVLKNRTTSSKWIKGVFIIFFSTFVYFISFMCEYKWDSVRMDLVSKFVGQFFNFSVLDFNIYSEILLTLLNTFVLSIFTTIVSTIIGLMLGLFAARNLSNSVAVNVIRAFAGFIRAVPTIIWVLIFVSGFGLTATTAFVGMSFHSVAYFIKSFSESFEEISDGTLEALKATGANWWQIVFSAVIPSSLTRLISWIAMRSEMNFAAAVIVGPAVGVPGTIGSLVNKGSREGNYPLMGACIIAIVLSALLFEMVITKYKQKSIIEE